AEAVRASPTAEPRRPSRCPVSQSLNCGTAPRRALILTEEQQADGVGVGVDYLIGGGIETAETTALRAEHEHRRAGAGEDVVQVRRGGGRHRTVGGRALD